MNQQPWTRVFYWIFQLIIWQRVWVVAHKIETSENGCRTSHTHWLLTHNAKGAARYYPNFVTFNTDDCPVRTRRSLLNTFMKFEIKFARHGEYDAVPLS